MTSRRVVSLDDYSDAISLREPFVVATPPTALAREELVRAVGLLPAVPKLLSARKDSTSFRVIAFIFIGKLHLDNPTPPLMCNSG